MFNLAIDSKLRGCDVVGLRVEDGSSWSRCRSCYHYAKRTGQPAKFEMTEQTREAVDSYIAAANKKPGPVPLQRSPLSGPSYKTRQYARLVGQWFASMGLDPSFFGTYSSRLRRGR
jgi:hypothetical protein